MKPQNGHLRPFKKPFDQPPPDFEVPDLERSEDLFHVAPPRTVDEFSERAFETYLASTNKPQEAGDYGAGKPSTGKPEHKLKD